MPGGSFSDADRHLPQPLFGDRFRACWRLKLQLAIVLLVLFDVPYFMIGHFPILPVRTLPLSAIDRVIGFHPRGWVWIYQSFYLLLNLIPWMATERWQLRRYLRGFVIVSVVSFACFLLFPIRGPQPNVGGSGGMYWLLQQYDVTLNSLPSLHAGLLVFTLCFGRRIGIRSFLILIWAALILYATLATKEHYLIDIVSGTALAIGVDWWVWRRDHDSTAAVMVASTNNFASSESTAGVRR